MKKIIILFFMLATFSFASTINSIDMVSNKLIIKTTDLKNYKVNYDSYNRLLFVEFIGVRSKNFSTKKLKSKYVESVKRVKYSDGVGVFITLNKNISYKIKKDRKNLTLYFVNNKWRKQYTIVVDAGHGGKDRGATGFKRYYEKNITLSVARYLARELSRDFNVIMTRNNDVFVTLGDRADIANKSHADMFVSIHANSAETSKLKGMEVFYFSKKASPYAERIAMFENSVGDKYGEKTNNIVQIMGELAYKKNQEISINLAKKLVKRYTKSLNMVDRGDHGANFAVLRGFNGPGVLIELGFINNRYDVRKLINRNYQKKMAREIASVIRAQYY